MSRTTVFFYWKLGPMRTRRIFIYFAKISVISSILQVRTLVLIPTKFCQTLPNFKSAVVLPQSRTIFCQMKIWQRQNLSSFLVEPNKFCQPSAYIWALTVTQFSGQTLKILKNLFSSVQPLNDLHDLTLVLRLVFTHPFTFQSWSKLRLGISFFVTLDLQARPLLHQLNYEQHLRYNKLLITGQIGEDQIDHAMIAAIKYRFVKSN